MALWFFNKKTKLADAGILEGFTDWHSHILPGVDDGIPTMEAALETLREYERLGFKRVWLTPHIMEDFPNKPEDLKKRFEELKSNWTGKVELRLAAENMLDTLFEERLDENDFLPIGEEGRHLLVETSYYTPPYNMEDLLDKAMSKGYFLILAHPERYRYMEEKDYRRLKEKGILFQMNLLSLVGAYGETARKKAEWLLSNDMIVFFGTDVHNVKSVSSHIQNSNFPNQFVKHLQKVVSSEELQ